MALLAWRCFCIHAAVVALPFIGYGAAAMMVVRVYPGSFAPFNTTGCSVNRCALATSSMNQAKMRTPSLAIFLATPPPVGSTLSSAPTRRSGERSLLAAPWCLLELTFPLKYHTWGELFISSNSFS